MQSVADAMNDAASTAAGHATKVKAAIGDAGPRALRSLSRVTYASTYVISYGVVYAAVFVVSALPQGQCVHARFPRWRRCRPGCAESPLRHSPPSNLVTAGTDEPCMMPPPPPRSI